MAGAPFLRHAAFCATLFSSLAAQAVPSEPALDTDFPPVVAPESRALDSAPADGDPLEPAPLEGTALSRDPREVAAIQQQIELLRERRSRQSLGGPITFMAIGAGTLLFSLYMFGLNSEYEDDTVVTYGILGGISGGAFVLGGSLWLGKRVRIRSDLSSQIRGLEQSLERPQLLPPPVEDEDEFGLAERPLVGARGYRGLELTLEF